ncbi:MAG: HEAT repeat domain-containing protein, partial [Haloquadratum sp.]
LVETHPDVVDSLAPFVDRVRDDDELYDRAAAKVIAAVGDTDHLDALIRASEFDPEFVEALVADASDGERRRAVEELRALATDDDPETRIRAVSAIHEAFFDDVDDPAAVFLDRLDDEGSTGYETVRGAAADGLQRVAADDPERLLDETDRLFEVAAAATTADDRPPTALVDVLAELAETDRDVYARAVDDLWASDEATQYVAASVLAEVATAYPPTLDDPVSRLLDLHDDDDREIAVGGAVRRALGGLAYVRPEAVEPAADRAVEWYREAGDTSGGHRRLVADLASAYPEVTTDLLEALAADYVDTYSGDFRLDDPDLAIALGHAARSGPERVREGIEPLFDRDPDDRPSSLPLVLIGLGDHESVPDGFVGEDGWLEDRLVDNDTERQQLRLVNLLDATAYQPARPLLEAVADGAAASDLVAGAASDALDRSS